MRGQRGHMLDQPVAVAALYPAICGVAAALEYRFRVGRVEAALGGDFRDRGSRG
jgi:hypothetical protein